MEGVENADKVLDISIHALRAEGDMAAPERYREWIRFQSTPSVRRATDETFAICGKTIISIHALRAEGDTARQRKPDDKLISIHALRAEGDFLRFCIFFAFFTFQSTPSVRRATTQGIQIHLQIYDFNPRPPCGGRLANTGLFVNAIYFNPRPPCGGRQVG